jgi:hypothetical protein
MCLRVAQEERVAIGPRAGDATDPDVASRAADVLDNDRLSERCLHVLGQNARERISRPDGERHDHGYRP